MTVWGAPCSCAEVSSLHCFLGEGQTCEQSVLPRCMLIVNRGTCYIRGVMLHANICKHYRSAGDFGIYRLHLPTTYRALCKGAACSCSARLGGKVAFFALSGVRRLQHAKQSTVGSSVTRLDVLDKFDNERGGGERRRGDWTTIMKLSKKLAQKSQSTRPTPCLQRTNARACL